MLYEISIKDLQPQTTACIRVCIKPERISAVLGEILPELWDYLERSEIPTAGPPFARYFEMKDDLVDLEAGLPVSGVVPGKGQIISGELPGGLAAFTWHIGPYGWLSQAHKALEIWIRDQERQPAGPPWEVYWTDPGEVSNPSEWKTEVIWPIQ